MNYRNGERHGLYRSWDLNGKLRNEISYKNGIYHGLYRSWDSNGNLCFETNYKNGIEINDNRYQRYEGIKEKIFNQ